MKSDDLTTSTKHVQAISANTKKHVQAISANTKKRVQHTVVEGTPQYGALDPADSLTLLSDDSKDAPTGLHATLISTLVYCYL